MHSYARLSVSRGRHNGGVADMEEGPASDSLKLAGRLVALVLIDLGHQSTPVDYYRIREAARDVHWPRSRALDIDDSPLRPF